MTLGTLKKNITSIAKAQEKVDNRLAKFVKDAIEANLTADKLKELNAHIKTVYSESFAKRVNGAINAPYKADKVEEAVARLEDVTSFTGAESVIKEVKAGKTTKKPTAKTNKKSNDFAGQDDAANFAEVLSQFKATGTNTLLTNMGDWSGKELEAFKALMQKAMIKPSKAEA